MAGTLFPDSLNDDQQGSGLGKKIGIAILIVFGLACLGLLLAFVLLKTGSPSNGTSSAREASTREAKHVVCSTAGLDGRATAEVLLEAWKGDEDARSLWLFDLEGTKLYAVTDFKLLRSGPVHLAPAPKGKKAPAATVPLQDVYGYVYRINSSTKGGLPVTKDWIIEEVSTGEECRVLKVEEWQ